AEGQDRRRRLSSVTNSAVSRHGANDRRGVEPPGQTDANRHVAPQTESDGAFEQLRDRFLGIWKRLQLDVRERPVGPLPPRAVEPDLERTSRRDLLYAGVEGRRGLIQ